MNKLFILFLFTSLNFIRCDDVYYIDGNRVLLYKIINWWYTESFQKGQLQPCNKPIKYERTNNIITSYNEQREEIKFNLGKSFASLISINTSEYINDNIKLKNNILSIKNFNENQYEKIKKSKNSLIITIKGEVAGLLENSGKVSLHNSGIFFRKCFYDNFSNKYPVTLEIFDKNKLLVKYDIKTSPKKLKQKQ